MTAPEATMTEETGLGIYSELNDLRDQFRDFRKWIIGGAFGMIVALVGQSAVVAWKASDVNTQVHTNAKSIAETKALAERTNEEQIRRSVQFEALKEIKEDMAAMRVMMQAVRDDVVRLQTKVQ
jgi:hypothetical protein